MAKESLFNVDMFKELDESTIIALTKEIQRNHNFYISPNKSPEFVNNHRKFLKFIVTKMRDNKYLKVNGQETLTTSLNKITFLSCALNICTIDLFTNSDNKEKPILAFSDLIYMLKLQTEIIENNFSDLYNTNSDTSVFNTAVVSASYSALFKFISFYYDYIDQGSHIKSADIKPRFLKILNELRLDIQSALIDINNGNVLKYSIKDSLTLLVNFSNEMIDVVQNKAKGDTKYEQFCSEKNYLKYRNWLDDLGEEKQAVTDSSWMTASSKKSGKKKNANKSTEMRSVTVNNNNNTVIVEEKTTTKSGKEEQIVSTPSTQTTTTSTVTTETSTSSVFPLNAVKKSRRGKGKGNKNNQSALVSSDSVAINPEISSSSSALVTNDAEISSSSSALVTNDAEISSSSSALVTNDAELQPISQNSVTTIKEVTVVEKTNYVSIPVFVPVAQPVFVPVVQHVPVAVRGTVVRVTNPGENGVPQDFTDFYSTKMAAHPYGHNWQTKVTSITLFNQNNNNFSNQPNSELVIYNGKMCVVQHEQPTLAAPIDVMVTIKNSNNNNLPIPNGLVSFNSRAIAPAKDGHHWEVNILSIVDAKETSIYVALPNAEFISYNGKQYYVVYDKPQEVINTPSTDVLTEKLTQSLKNMLNMDK